MTKHSQGKRQAENRCKWGHNQVHHPYLTLIRCYRKLKVKTMKMIFLWKKRSSHLPLHLTHLMRSGGPQEKGGQDRCSHTRCLVNLRYNHIPMSMQFTHTPHHTYHHSYLTIFHYHLSCFHHTCHTLIHPTHALHPHFIE